MEENHSLPYVADNSTNNFTSITAIVTTTSNGNISEHMGPQVPRFDEVSMIKTLVMGCMFFVSLFGNLATLVQMYRMRRRKSTVNTLIVNLATADLLVTFFCMGTEAIWASTVQWYAGDVMCKVVKFGQVFSLNLSTCVTVVISLDRCCVVIDPMSRHKAARRVRIMIIVSWMLCALFSVPQILIFKVVQAPFKEHFVQCIDRGYLVEWGQKVYYIVSALFSFIIPLLIMGTAYGLISGTITRKSRYFREPETSSVSSDHGHVRGNVRSHLFRKARRLALRMSIVIVAAFIICWTPYYVLFTCFTFLNLQQMPRETMLAFSFIGLSNSLLNPMIYGAFHLCKMHNPRSWRRHEWPSYTMKSPRSAQKIPALAEDHTPRWLVVNKRKNVMVLCHRDDQVAACRKDKAKQQCLFVLYKVHSDEEGVKLFEPTSTA